LVSEVVGNGCDVVGVSTSHWCVVGFSRFRNFFVDVRASLTQRQRPELFDDDRIM